MGSFARPVSIIALIWTFFVAGALTIPSLDGSHLPAKAAAVAIAVGLITYALIIRPRITAGRAGPPR